MVGMKNAFAYPRFDSNQPDKGLSIDLSVSEGCRLLSVYPRYNFIDTITDKKTNTKSCFEREKTVRHV